MRARNTDELLANVVDPDDLPNWQHMADRAGYENRKTGAIVSYAQLIPRACEISVSQLVGGLNVIEYRGDAPTPVFLPSLPKTCEYCRSTVDCTRSNCRNCGAST